MNSKTIIIAIVVLAIIVGGIFFISSKGSGQPVLTPSQTQTTSQNPPAQSQNIVTLTQDGFSPSTLTVKAGTKVTWMNKSGGDAAIDSNPHPVHTSYPPLNLGSFSDGSTLSLTFDKANTYQYHNHLNPSQTGTITVQ